MEMELQGSNQLPEEADVHTVIKTAWKEKKSW